MENIKEKIPAIVRTLIDKHTYLIYDKENQCFSCDVYADYRDTVEEKTVSQWCASEDPYNAFYEDLYEWYKESVWECEDDVIKTVRDNWPNAEISYIQNEEYIVETVREMLVINLPEEHFLKQTVCVNIMVDTGDENYDYVSNCFYPHYNGRYGETIPNEASVLWLAKQQGYKKSQLNTVMRRGEHSNSKLLKSLRTEVLNCSSHMNALVFFVEMSIEQLFRLQEAIQENKKNDKPLPEGAYRCVWERSGRKRITIDKSAICGLYDAWSGAGSVLDIALEQDVVLPIRYISSALPDGARGCSVANVYGVNSSLWTPTLKKIS